MQSLKAIRAALPLSCPLPPSLNAIPTSDLNLEHELARNPTNLSRWFSYIKHIKEDLVKITLNERGTETVTPIEKQVLGKKLSNPSSRLGFQRLCSVYERALLHFPVSYKLWNSYLTWRREYVTGTVEKAQRVKLNAPKPRVDLAENEKLYGLLKADRDGTVTLAERDWDGNVVDPKWEGSLDGLIGLEEWQSLAGTYERALTCMPMMPRFWISYLSLFFHPSCPASLSHSHARRTFDRCLRTLPKSLHQRIWRLYLNWSANVGSSTLTTVWQRYLKVDPFPTEYYITLLLPAEADEDTPPTAPLEAVKLLLSLSRKALKGSYKSPEQKSSFQLLVDWLEVCEKYAEIVGVDLDQSVAVLGEPEKKTPVEDGSELPSEFSGLIRMGNVQADGEKKKEEVYDADCDSNSDRKIDVEKIVRKDGLEVYKDQAGRLWTGLATYWIKKGELDHARKIFEEGLKQVLTVRDFTQVFDAYAEFSESFISGMMDLVASGEADAEEEADLDQKMIDFEALMDRRPFLVNEVLLRRNPNDVQEWEKRVVLFGTDDEKIDETYQMATETINPRKATMNFHQLFINWAKSFEQGGAAILEEDKAEKDLVSARKVYEKAVTIPFKRVDDLAEVWCSWAEMEVRNDCFDEAIAVMARATITPRKTNINFHDEKLPSQARLFKSLKLWSYRADLEESLGSVESAKAVYDKILELKIANAQVIVNYANFLEENNYWEDSFKVYERGLELFTYPIRFELLNAYLAKFVARYGGDKIERARDLFEEAVTKCPPKFAKTIFLMYGKMEEEHGLAKRAMKIYDRATEAVDKADQFEAFEVLIAKTAANFGLPATRTIYQRAIETLPDQQTAEMCLRFSALERKLGEIDRARAIYAHGSQFCDPRVNPNYWQAWHSFELDTGSEDTFREYLRIKRAVQARFNTESAYIRSAVARPSGAAPAEDDAPPTNGSSNPMDDLDAAATANKPSFVPATNKDKLAQVSADDSSAPAKETPNNQDEVELLDVDDDDE